MESSVELNLASSIFKANPYSAFAQIRSQDPVHQMKRRSGRIVWLITRYKDADAVLRDQRFVKDVGTVFPPEELARRFPWVQEQRMSRPFFHHMLNADPPDHTRLRSLISMSFTSHLVEQWHERIEAITNELLDAVQDQGKMDLIADFASPLPISIISEMLGVPTADRRQFAIWSSMLIEATGDSLAFKSAYTQLWSELVPYLHKMIDEKRKLRSDDLLSGLLQVESEGERLSEDELIAMIYLLLIAGQETTVHLISNGVLALLQHPGQMKKLKENPTLIRTAIEEFLRYQGPLLTATQRWAREDVEFGGKLIRRGEEVIVILAAANRDDEVFPAAEELNITRQENRHLAFGKGIHYCLGAPLARLEGQVAIGSLLRRLPNLRLNTEVDRLVWRPGSLMLGLRELPVAF